MKWGSFGVVHFASLAIAALLVVGLYFALKKANLKVKTIVLGVLSFSGIAAIIYNLFFECNGASCCGVHPE